MYMNTHNKVRSIDAEMLFREGQQFQEHDAFAKALESYQRAKALDPTRSALHFQIGVVLAKLGRWSEAEQAYLEAIRLEPNRMESHLNLGFVYYELGLDQRAQDEFEHARRLSGLANP